MTGGCGNQVKLCICDQAMIFYAVSNAAVAVVFPNPRVLYYASRSLEPSLWLRLSALCTEFTQCIPLSPGRAMSPSGGCKRCSRREMQHRLKTWHAAFRTVHAVVQHLHKLKGQVLVRQRLKVWRSSRTSCTLEDTFLVYSSIWLHAHALQNIQHLNGCQLEQPLHYLHRSVKIVLRRDARLLWR